MTAERPELTDILLVTMEHKGRKIDVGLPSQLSIAEFLPAVVAERNWLTTHTATHGFHLLTPRGSILDMDLSLAEQGVESGTLLHLEVLGNDEELVRYDDLVEAMGDSVSELRTAWKPGDSVRLSSFVAAALVAISGLLVVLGMPTTLSGPITAVAAILMVLVGALVARAPSSRVLPPGGGAALILSAVALFGMCALALTPGELPFRFLSAGVTTIVASVAFFVLKGSARAYAGIPLLAGSILSLYGLQQWVWDTPSQQAASLLVGFVALLVLILPWIGVAQMPVRIPALSSESVIELPPREVGRQLRVGETLTIALRIAASACTVALTPLIAVDALGGLLMTAVCLALLLGTRSLYGRTEVYIGLVGGILALTLTGVLLAILRPTLFPWILAVVAFVSAFIIANNVVSVKLRPRLTRLADVINVLSIAAICPVIALIWGVV
jgi:hypothetical protein